MAEAHFYSTHACMVWNHTRHAGAANLSDACTHEARADGPSLPKIHKAVRGTAKTQTHP